MRYNVRFLVVALLLAGIFSACNRRPDHARYIPADAIAVASVNVKGLSTKIAWNVVTGSKLFKEIQKHLPDKSAKDAMGSIESAGIDALNTFYVYVKADNRDKGNSRITGLVPLSDAARWEDFVKRSFPQATIKVAGNRKEASLGRDMYVGWTDNLLVVLNVSSASYGMDDEGGPSLNIATAQADMTAEMNNVFSVTEETSIIKNELFRKFTDEGHDVGFWLNYEQMMTQYSADMANKVGVALSGTLWKDAVFTTGLDFKKGQITGDMRYYLSPDMKEAGKEFAAKNADKDLVARLPGKDVDLLWAMHLSPKALRLTLEKTGLLGLANIGLNNVGLNVDYVLDAFTGDMAMIMNNFSLTTETVTDDFLGQQVQHTTQKPALNISYALRINKKENFMKLVEMARMNGLVPIQGGYAMPLTLKDSVYVLINDQFAALSNKYANVSGILSGAFTGEKKESPAFQNAMEHPFLFHLDMKQMFEHIDAGIAQTARDSIMLMESKKLLSDISLMGGDYKDGAVSFHLDVNFANKDENAILQLMDYGMKVNDAQDK